MIELRQVGFYICHISRSVILHHETSMPTETGHQVLSASDDVQNPLDELRDIDEILRGNVSD